jgi:hypothetical protein
MIVTMTWVWWFILGWLAASIIFTAGYILGGMVTTRSLEEDTGHWTHAP